MLRSLGNNPFFFSKYRNKKKRFAEILYQEMLLTSFREPSKNEIQDPFKGNFENWNLLSECLIYIFVIAL